jgi:capsular exopolysaccharide synthesis family protein
MDKDEITPGFFWELALRYWPLMAIGGLLGLGLGVLWVANEEPVYRSRATLVLDSAPDNNLLSDLVALTSAPRAVSEIEILRSRSIAEAVVAEPDREPGAAIEEEELHLGLRILVDDEGLRPLSARFGGTSAIEQGPRLTVLPSPNSTAGGAREVRLEFLAPDRVKLSGVNALGFSTDAVESDFEPGGEVSYEGLSMRLFPHGDVVGASFLVRHLSHKQAVDRVNSRTRVGETDRNSGVITISFDDTDPHRSAATTNALCRNYLRWTLRHSEKRASQTVDFVEEQLEDQIKSLNEAELEVVQLQQESHTSVDIGETARALIEELSSLEVERVQLTLAEKGLQEALELLRAGEFEALSRLGPELADPITQVYIEQVALLTAESESLDRRESGPYKARMQQRVFDVRSRSETVRIELEALRDTARRLEGEDSSVPTALAAMGAVGTGDPLLASYATEWTELDSRLRELRKEFKGTLPEAQNLAAEVHRIEERILEHVRGRIAGLEVQRSEYAELQAGYEEGIDAYPEDERQRIGGALTSLEARISTHLTARLGGIGGRRERLGEELRSVEERLVQLPEDQRRLADPLRRLEAHTEIVKLLLGRQKEAELARAATLSTAEFIDTAVPSLDPIGPSITLHVFLGVITGMILAFGWIVFRESRDRSIFTGKELEEASGVPVLGIIPDFRRGRDRVRNVGDRYLALRDHPESAVAEAYRSLRSNLKFVLNSGKDLKTLACTSCLASEGKSLTNANMALGFAMIGRRVLLIDADIRRPTVAKTLELDGSPGLVDILRGEIPWRDCLQSSGHDNLEVISSGEIPDSPGDLLTSDRLRELLVEIRPEYDLIVFDIPPALLVSDVECFSSLDAVLLLCRGARVSRGMMTHAVRRLEQVGTNLVGTVLNAVPGRLSRKAYGSSYGYGYGYGYGNEARKTGDKSQAA